MTTVVMPDGTHVELPDSPSPQEVAALSQMATPQAGAMENIKEIGRVADKSVRKGITALPGIIGDAALATMRNMPRVPGLFGLPRLIDDVTDPNREGPIAQSKFGDVQKALETGAGLLPPVSVPKTNLGKGVANILEPAISAASSGGMANLGQRATIGLASGVGGEAAGRATNDNPIARVLGAILGGGAAGVAQSWRPNAKELIQDSTSQMRGSDWKKAEVLEAILTKENLPHLKSQLLGPRSTLDDVVSAASANPVVKPKLTTAIQGVPKAVEELVSLKTKANLPVEISGRAQALDDIQKSAENAIRGLKQKSNTAFTDTMPAEGTLMAPERVQGLYKQLLDLSKSSKYGETSDAGKAIRNYAEDLVASRTAPDLAASLNPTMVLRAKKAGTSLADVPGPKGEDALTFVTDAHKVNNLIKELSLKVSSNPDYRGLPVADVKRLMVQATPEFDVARSAKQAIMETEVNPAKKSLTGLIAGMGGGVRPDKVTAKDTAIDLVFMRGPKGQEIRELAKNIGDDGVGSLLREHIARTMQNKKLWPTEFASAEVAAKAPAKLGDTLAGAKWQRENINAVLEVLAKSNKQNPEEVQKGFYHLVRGLETYKDARLSPGISPGQVGQIASTNFPGALAEPFGATRRLFGARATTKTYDKLASIILAPGGLKQLEAIARSPQPERIKALTLSVMQAADTQDDEK